MKNLFPNKWKKWSSAVFKRDGRRCQFVDGNGKKCGKKKRLVPHHIRKKSDYPMLAFVVDNGITLCNEHHVYSVTGHEELYAPVFMRIVKENKGKSNGKN